MTAVHVHLLHAAVYGAAALIVLWLAVMLVLALSVAAARWA